MHRDAGRRGPPSQVTIAGGTDVDDASDRNARRVPVERRLVGVIVGGENQAPRGNKCVAMQVRACGAGEHDAGPVVVLEDDRSLERPGGEHDAPGPHMPEALLAQGAAVMGREMGSNTLRENHSVLIQLHRRGCRRQHARIGGCA